MVPGPSIGFLFHPFPFSHTFFHPFVSCLSLLHVLSSHSLSFSCARIGPGLSLYARIYCALRFQVAQVLRFQVTHEVWLFVPVHFSLQPRTFLSRLSSFSCLHLFVHAARTRAHLFVT